MVLLTVYGNIGYGLSEKMSTTNLMMSYTCPNQYLAIKYADNINDMKISIVFSTSIVIVVLGLIIVIINLKILIYPK